MVYAFKTIIFVWKLDSIEISPLRVQVLYGKNQAELHVSNDVDWKFL